MFLFVLFAKKNELICKNFAELCKNSVLFGTNSEVFTKNFAELYRKIVLFCENSEVFPLPCVIFSE